ncbi:DHH family phosphoesterase [Paenactinomyces guangxiensis]|uniref:Cyclic-di-AMP phosphodiesterase n=1 Tax=Paenactinomyces guangxiensis TaxID=1490290 RepID=A0A7W2A8E6_9BACL|nr:DHH family phosphoesterase [Paenactinomyces guangxiensis]MBA4494089.1 DHH family phosphoesterase [Paenactinomyces guangxiensis]MBH8591166.1 DHH family phosphoesterase [Paenactinomyces guangxiensis]
MPKFIIQRWHGYHMVFAMCFCLVLIALLSTYKWIYGIVGLVLFTFLALVLYYAERAFRKDFTEYVLTLAHRVKNASQSALDQLPVGILLYDRNGEIEWHNPFVHKMSERERLVGSFVDDVFPELKQAKSEGEGPFRIHLGKKSFEVIHQPEERLYFFRDVSRLDELQKRYQEEQTILGFLHMDNFDEAGQGLSDQESAQLLSNLTSVISKWALEYNITLKRIDTDKMFFVTQYQSLQRLIKSRFDILDAVREMTRHYKIPVTLSIGVASVGETMIERSQNAQAALDIALARGGDQAAVQSEERVVFFGGKTNAVEKRTRVRARVISHAMSNLIRDSQRVLVMGHTQPDMDALGAAIGVVKFALINDCEAYIVLDEENVSIERLMTAVYQHEYLGEHVIHPEKALLLADDPDTLLILVDTHKPSLTIEPRLLERAERTVVIDHHRRGEDFVKDPVLVYLEPYASSTSELVTELLQYQDGRLAMDTLEATALLAGIVVDTKNFAFRAGSRTFEAASFLRRHGADLMMVQSLLKEDLAQYVKRAEIVKNTEVLYGNIAIATGDEAEVYDQLLIAQAADTLLNMQGVGASFVIGMREDGLISVSARSQGELNVQLVMEEMGGGGHLTNAACQLKNTTIQETKERLLEVLKETLESGGTQQ